LLLGLLTLHFVTRQQAARAMPLRDRAFYPYVYRVSLSLLAGQGFEVFRLSDAPASRPVAEFLALQRKRLSPEEFHAFEAGPDARPITFPPPSAEKRFPNYMGEDEILTNPLHTTRVLDVYVTALLWKVFGIRWSVLATFCAVCSTLSGLLVFLIGRRLGGGFWPGWLAPCCSWRRLWRTITRFARCAISARCGSRPWGSSASAAWSSAAAHRPATWRRWG
jgi:hypothetical protein